MSFAGFAQTAASYSFSASNSTTYTSISSSGTYVSACNSDDGTQTSISIGFNFVYCGTTYTTLSANANGWLSLVNSSSSGFPTYINDPSYFSSYMSSGNGFLMAQWDDMYYPSCYYSTTGSSPNRVFTFEWGTAYHCCSASGANASFQVKLYETTNVIEYIYGSSSFSSSSATIGIANSSSDYLTLSDASSSPTASSTTFTTSISTGSPATNQVYRWTPPVACSGAPSAGTAVSSVGSACPSASFTLSLSGYTISTGVTYQWQSSPDSATWTNISGATSLTCSTTESAATYYRCVVTCTSASASGYSVGVLVPYLSACYCTPSFYYSSNSCSLYNFAIGSLYSPGESSTVLNDNASCNNSGYLDRTSLSVSYMQGTTYATTVVSNTTSYSYQLDNQIWIDFNNDGTFDNTEIVGGVSNYSSGSPVTVVENIVLPITAPVGARRMRIVVVYHGMGVYYPSIDPCPSGSYPYYYGEARDYTVNIVPLPACTGTPTGGTASSSAGTVCPSQSFTLNLTGYTGASGLTFQWQSSSTGTGGWSNISGATTIPYTLTESASLYYRCVVTCTASGGSANSASVLVNYIGVCYCTPSYSSSYSCGYGYYISGFNITGESSTSISDGSGCDGSGYLDQTGLSVSLEQSYTYACNLSTGTTAEVQAWIDFDDDGTFASSETLGGASYFYSGSFNITIPVTAPVGSHRMRVAMTSSYWGYYYPSLDPCYPGYYGEARDYTVNIVPLPACTGTPTAGSASASLTTACSSTSFTLTVSGFSAASSLSFQWQQSSTGSGGWSDITGATSITYSTTESATTYYRCVVTCTASGLSANSASTMVNHISVCYCTPSYSSSYSCTYGYSFSSFSVTGESSTSISDGSSCDGTGYLDQTSMSVSFEQSYTYSVSASFGTTAEVQTWIDFNDDGTFDASESVGGASYFSYSGSYNVVIPATAPTGAHRMRVAMTASYWGYSYPSLDPCYPGYYGETRDYTVNIVPLPACTGTPSPGTVSSSASTACPSLSFSLTVTGFTAAGSLAFQWQSSSDSSSWTNISGATSVTCTTTESAATYYRCIVTCTATSSSAYTPGYKVNYFPVCYCHPSYINASMACSSYNMVITEYHVIGEAGSSFDDVSSCDGTGYKDMTSLSVNLKQSITYTPTIYGDPSTSYPLSMQTWIDFNDDGTFDATESVGGANFYYASVVFNLTIPVTATPGVHMMRVVTSYYYSGHYYPTMDPCTYGYYYGESRDYLANIIALPACTGTPTAGTATCDVGTACPSSTFNLTVSGFSVASGLTFQWQSSTDSASWTSISGATSTTYNYTESSMHFYRCVVTCAGSGSSAPSTGVKVNYIGVCYCTPTYYYASNACTSTSYNFALAKVQGSGYGGTSLNDTAACTGTGYQDRTSLSISYMQSVAYVMTVTSKTGSSSYNLSNQVFIDFNDDGTFDASETVGGTSSYSGTTAIAVQYVTMPLTATVGSHRMRVVQLYAGYGTVYPYISGCPTGSYPYYYGEARDYTVNIVALPPCSGTPAPGTAWEFSNTACPSSVIHVVDTGFSTSSGLTFQWQSSSDSSSWSNISGATGNVLVTSETATTYFRCVVTCSASGSSAATNGFKVIYLSACFCTPYFAYSTNACSLYGMAMAQVKVIGNAGSTLNDSMACDGTGYEDHTASSVDFMQSVTYTMSIKSSPTTYSYTKNAQVWIDFNNNSTFESTESIGGINSYIARTAFNITIPLTATTGAHRMRVEDIYTGSGPSYPSLDPCVSGSYYGEARDYTANIVPLPPCSGTPTAGTASASTFYACPSTAFTLTLTGYTVASSITFQWQSSSDSSTWTAISGATTSSYSATVTAATYYRCLVTCTISSSSAISVPVHVNYISYCYCTPSFYYAATACSGYTFALGKVQSAGESGTMLNDTAVCTGAGYQDRTSLASPIYYQGATYVMTVTSSLGASTSSYSLSNQVWIDFNDNGTFESTEVVGGNSSYSGLPAIVSENLVMPSSASTGLHRLRIVQVYAGYGVVYPSIDPCPSGSYPYYYGEARDYMVNIQPLPPCTGTPSAGVATASTAVACPSYSFTLGLTGSSVASGLTYQWQSSSDSTSWSNISGATNYFYTTTESAATYFRCVITCTSTSSSAHSALVFVNYISACYCVPTPSSAYASCYSYGMTVHYLDLPGASGTIHDIASCDGSGYLDRSSLSCTMFQGSTYACSVANGGSNQTKIQFWVDFNNNATFESSESIGGTNTGFYNTSVSLTIPSGAPTGTFRMREVMSYAFSSYSYPTLDPCMYSYTYGEARDYTVTISSSVCSGTPTAGTLSASSSTSCTLPFSTTLTASGFTTSGGTSIVYSWESSSDSTTWTRVSGATDYSYSPSVTSGPIYYRFVDSCTASASVSRTAGVRLYQSFAPTVSAISGSGTVCAGVTTAYTDATAGGTWTSSNTSLATVTSTGVVRGVSAGADTIMYSLTNACGTTTVSGALTVLPAPDAGIISGASSVCQYVTTTLSSTISGGAWTSSAMSVATVDGTTGVVTGVTAGTVSISYAVNTVCGTAVATHPMTISPAPVAGTISGPTAVCPATTISLTSTISGGTWRARNGNASISTSGVVTGITSGTDDMVYTYTNSCGSDSSVRTVTISPVPNAGSITGPSNVCTGLTITLTDAATGGTWYATNASASVSSSGVVTGVSTGTDTIRYRVINSCGSDSASKVVTISLSPDAGTITGGSATLCEAGSITLSDAISGGTWTATNGNATVSGGVVNGITTGFDTIRYTVTNSCGIDTATQVVFVNALPHAGIVSGIDTICTGISTTLTTTGTGGTWVRSNTHASVTSAGVVTGVSGGIDTIMYNVTNVCGTDIASHPITVIPTATAAPITGVVTVCEAANITLHESDTTGVWSEITGHSTVVGGVVTGVTAGSDTIYYTVTNYCGSVTASHAITVNPLPQAGTITAAITTICSGDTTAYIDTVSGAVWSSSDVSVATVSIFGGVHGVAGGSAIISVTVTNTCGTAIATLPVTINQTPIGGTVFGTSNVCVGSYVTYGDTLGTPGGAWSSANTSIATVDASGQVFGVSPGTTTISYVIATATCGTAYATRTITVNTLPYTGTIAGPISVCVGSNITLTHSGGLTGTWSSSTTSVGTVTTGSPSSTTVHGVAVGNTTITYSVTTATCGSAYVTAVVSVLPLPVAGTITGGTIVCESASIALTNVGGTAGGTWSSSDTTRAHVSSGGVVTGILAGSVTITYTAVTATCGTAYTTLAMTISPLPVPGTITGFATVCPGSTTTLTDAATGGVWSMSNSHATIASSGVVHGVTSGLDTAIYSVTNSCGTRRATLPMIVAPLPDAGSISGPSTVCLGSSITLVDTVSGGSWMSSNSHATVSGGVVTGMSVGAVVIYYSIINYCGTATIADSIIVLPILTPSVAVTTTPSTSVCTGDYVTFTATATNGGTAPSFIWVLNGVVVSTTSTFGYIPSTGDHVSCKMISNAPCRTVDTAYNPGLITMIVNDPVTPTVNITQSNDSVSFLGQVITFTASITNGGSAPTYQWVVNGVNVPGATSATFAYAVTGPCVVRCILTSNAPCVDYPSVTSDPLGVWAESEGLNNVHASLYSMSLYPNPNNGVFVLSGIVNKQSNADINFDVVDMTGKVLYSGKTTPFNGAINQQVDLGQSIVPGQYMLRVVNENGSEFIHFSIMK